jgi:hypothetical protein
VEPTLPKDMVEGDIATLFHMRLRNQAFSRGRTLLLWIAAAFGLNSCLAGGGEPTCTTQPTPPVQIALDPDSLRLEPFSYSSHLSRSDGEFESYTRNFRLYPSDSGTAYAFGYFDSSGLSLFADGRRIPTPAFRYESRGMGQCGAYTYIETKTDTGFTLQVRKGDSAVRSWKVESRSRTSTSCAPRRIPPR